MIRVTAVVRTFSISLHQNHALPIYILTLLMSSHTAFSSPNQSLSKKNQHSQRKSSIFQQHRIEARSSSVHLAPPDLPRTHDRNNPTQTPKKSESIPQTPKDIIPDPTNHKQKRKDATNPTHKSHACGSSSPRVHTNPLILLRPNPINNPTKHPHPYPPPPPIPIPPLPSLLHTTPPPKFQNPSRLTSQYLRAADLLLPLLVPERGGQASIDNRH